MTLLDVIAHVLDHAGKSLTVQEIADKINADNLYRRRKDNNPVEPKQIMLRLGNNLDKFSVLISLKD
jgi:transcriptional regulator of met regulon